MRRATLLAGLLMVLCAAAPAQAQRGWKIYGTWRSTSGNVFHIQRAGQGAFHLTVTWSSGAQAGLRGEWVRGLRGTQFQYWHGAHSYSGTFSADDPNRIRVQASDGTVSWWQRDQAPPAPPASAASIQGSWRSSSGNFFSIQPSRRGLRLFFTRSDGVQSMLRGNWVAGMEGTQFQYWDATHSYTGTFSPGDPNRIRVHASDGQVSWWQRSYGSPAVARPPVVTTVGYPTAPPRPVACWSHTDPGCRRTRNGVAPMDRNAFVSLLGLVQSAKPHVFPMKDRLQAGVGSRYLTSQQLARLLDEFKPHVWVMLDVVKLCAPRLVDPENGVGPVAQKFSPHTMVGTDAARVLASQRGDQY